MDSGVSTVGIIVCLFCCMDSHVLFSAGMILFNGFVYCSGRNYCCFASIMARSSELLLLFLCVRILIVFFSAGIIVCFFVVCVDS